MAGLNELERYLETAQLLTWGEAVLEGAHPDKHRMVLEGGVQVMAKPGHISTSPWSGARPPDGRLHVALDSPAS